MKMETSFETSIETKVCTRCEQLRPVSSFQKDYRRKGKEGFYQNPCKDCRKETKVAKANISQNIDNDWYIRHLLVFRSKFNKEDVTPELIVAYRTLLKIKKLAEEPEQFFLKDNLLFCTNCKKVHKLPNNIGLNSLVKLIEGFKNNHKKCKNES